MRTMRTLLTGATAIALCLAPISFGAMPFALGIGTAEAATANVSINVFFKPLASHGVWVKHPKYHYVFCPKVDAKWRPYTHGHWLYMKNYGWYFASDEPFAWAVYHYGRWFSDQKLGWCWVPGNAWAGAWVSWRRGNDYIGWAPLEPAHDGFAVDVDISKQEPPKHDWVFVQPKRFLQPKLAVEIVFGDQAPDAFQKTQFAGPVVVQNNIVVNNIIDVNFIQQQTNTKVVVVEPKPVDDPAQAKANADGTTINVFAPQIPAPKQDEAPAQSVDESQAQVQLGNASSSEAPSSEQPSSSMSSSQASSSEASSVASSSEASSSAASSEASSSASASSASSAIESSALPASSEAASSEVAPAPATSSSAAEPTTSSMSSSEATSSSAEPASSSQAAPASSSVEASSATPSSLEASSVEPQASSAAPLQCDDGFVLVKGKCVPVDASSSAAQ